MRPCNGSQAARAYTERLTASPPESETNEIASALVGLHASREPGILDACAIIGALSRLYLGAI